MSKQKNSSQETSSNTLSLKAWIKSDVGRVRKNNEDNSLADTANNLFVVADGMGGHEHGDLASGTAVESVRNYLHNAMTGLKAFAIDPSEERSRWAEQVILGAVQAANADVYNQAVQKGVQENMGTTMSMMIVLSANRAIIGHVGDSRIYRVRNKEVAQLTEDQTLLMQQIKSGAVRPEDADKVPYGGTLLQAIGYRAEVNPDIFWIDIQPGDQFLLCSDGLSNYLIEDEIVTVFSKARGEQIVPRLIDCANARGGRDNITAVVVEVEDPNDNLGTTQLDLSSDILSQCPLFSGFEMAEIMRLLPLGQLRAFISDETLQMEGGDSQGLFMILAGRVGLYRRNTWLMTVGPGGHFGDFSLFDHRSVAETAVCEEEVRAILFPHDSIRNFTEESPELGIKLLYNLGEAHVRRLRNHEGRLVQVLGQS
ncbi:MAG: cyclic nucleotide-binding domain-containing protein [Deltaproteobacteria bacterium]|nr:MAG: cyclic nucleotide-binding domain-containing protein [Deltaproteobacteria bacterium]